MKRILFCVIGLLFLIGSFLAGYWYRTRDGGTVACRESATDSSGIAPESSGQEGVEDEMSPGTVRVSAERQQKFGIEVEVAKKASETHMLRMVGRVAADETRVYRVIAATEGWIRETFNNTTGSQVEKDEPLASLYSREFLSAEQAYIYALNALDRFLTEETETQGQLDLTKANIQQYIDSLRTLGMSDLQIQEIARTRKLTQDILIRSPAAGFVITRNISPGLRFDKGTEFYRIADLRHVWILADLFENEAQYLKPGKAVKVTLLHQKRILQAKVSEVLPQFDPTTRTLKVRLELDNPGYILRPDMFVDVELPVTLPPAIVIPADAILDSGLKKMVFVDRGNGLFEPREVETGWRFENRAQIMTGLRPGERIVVSGNFLVDSESRLELAAAGMYGTLATDPVSGTSVSTRKAEKTGMKSVYRGQTYYFSSTESKRQFDRNPARYTAVQSEEKHD
jgi:membrane fusion protein, copper/silver efflux system